MKLYMLPSFRWDQPMDLIDGSGRVRYRISGNAYAPGKRLRVTDLAGRDAVHIRQTVPALFPTYELEVYGKPVGALVKDLCYERPRCHVDTLGWELTGPIGSMEYEITRQGGKEASCHPDPENPSRLELDLGSPPSALAALAVMVAVNCILSPQEPRHL